MAYQSESGQAGSGRRIVRYLGLECKEGWLSTQWGGGESPPMPRGGAGLSELG